MALLAYKKIDTGILPDIAASGQIIEKSPDFLHPAHPML